MMRPNVLASKIIALVISILFITPTITWPAPESCLRQLPLLERSTLDAKIAKAKEDLAQLNSFAGDYSRQLDNVKAQIAESPTIASKKLFGLVAERLMFILKDMKAVKEYIIANDSARSPPNINFHATPIISRTTPTAIPIVKGDRVEILPLSHAISFCI